MAALTMRMWRSWTSISTRVRAWVAADADVVQAAVDAQGDGAGFVDTVGAHAVVGVEACCRVGFGAAV